MLSPLTKHLGPITWHIFSHIGHRSFSAFCDILTRHFVGHIGSHSYFCPDEITDEMRVFLCTSLTPINDTHHGGGYYQICQHLLTVEYAACSFILPRNEIEWHTCSKCEFIIWNSSVKCWKTGNVGYMSRQESDFYLYYILIIIPPPPLLLLLYSSSLPFSSFSSSSSSIYLPGVGIDAVVFVLFLK